MHYLLTILIIIVFAQAMVIHESDDVNYVQALKSRIEKQDKILKKAEDTLDSANYQIDKYHEAVGVLCKSFDYTACYAKDFCTIVRELKKNDPRIMANFDQIEEILKEMEDTKKCIEKKFLSLDNDKTV